MRTALFAFGLSLLACCGASEAVAQTKVTVVTSCGSMSPGSAQNAGTQGVLTVDINGNNCGSGPGGTSSPPYGFTHLGGRQLALSSVASTALTVPTGAVYATVQANTATVYYSLVGATPSASDGSNQLLPGQPALFLSGADVLANFKAVSATGTITVEYFK